MTGDGIRGGVGGGPLEEGATDDSDMVLGGGLPRREDAGLEGHSLEEDEGGFDLAGAADDRSFWREVCEVEARVRRWVDMGGPSMRVTRSL